MPPSLVIFDLDGTLIDSSGDISDALRASLSELGFALRSEEEIIGMIGEGLTRLIERALGHEHESPANVDAVRATFRRHYGANLVRRTVLYPGIRELVDSLATKATLAVATNKPGPWARSILEQLHVGPRFREVVGDGDAGVERKPSASMIETLCLRTGVAKADCVLVGDSHIDVLAGRAAGVKTIVVSWGYDGQAELDRARPPERVQSVAELSERLMGTSSQAAPG